MRRRTVLLVLGLVALLGLVAGFGYLPEDETPPPRLTEEQLLAYEAALLPHLREGGKTVERGMKPGVDDLLNKHVVPPATIAVEAETWAADLTRVRTALAAVEPPPQLTEVSQLFDDSLDAYVQAAHVFAEAARAPEAQRRAIANRGYDLGRTADRIYDSASRIIQTARRNLGLGPSSDFPDPETRDAPS